MNEEATAILLYGQYGIDEWNEKCQILSVSEKIQVLTELKEEGKSDLSNMVKRPFPEFVCEYFRSFPAAKCYFEDPAFAYKLYFLDDYSLRFFTEKMRDAGIRNREIAELYGISSPSINWKEEIAFLEETPLGDFPKISSYKKKNNYLVKYLHLCKYINFSEAERLGLPAVQAFLKDKSDGYEIDTKLSHLNPAVRTAVELHLGLGGCHRFSYGEISAALFGLVKTDIVVQAIDFIIPKLLKSTAEFDYLLGFKEEFQTPGNACEYRSNIFRDIDIALETRAIAHRLSPEAKKVLSAQHTRERAIYLASKYMFKTPESLARNLRISLKEATERLGF